MRERRAVLGEVVIDVSSDLCAWHNQLRRCVVVTVFPCVAAASLVVAALGMVFDRLLGNKREALNLADRVLSAVAKRIATKVAAWLGPAERAVSLMSELYTTETLGRVPDACAISA